MNKSKVSNSASGGSKQKKKFGQQKKNNQRSSVGGSSQLKENKLSIKAAKKSASYPAISSLSKDETLSQKSLKFDLVSNYSETSLDLELEDIDYEDTGLSFEAKESAGHLLKYNTLETINEDADFNPEVHLPSDNKLERIDDAASIGNETVSSINSENTYSSLQSSHSMSSMDSKPSSAPSRSPSTASTIPESEYYVSVQTTAGSKDDNDTSPTSSRRKRSNASKVDTEENSSPERNIILQLAMKKDWQEVESRLRQMTKTSPDIPKSGDEVRSMLNDVL